MLFGATERIIHRFEVKKGVARAFDRAGEETRGVPLREPTFVRPAEYETDVNGVATTAFRHNT